MDRREFLKMLSMMAAGFALFGCREGGAFSGAAGGSSQAKTPSLADFENEVRLALSKMKPGFDLVRVPMPEAIKTRGSSSENRFGMAIDLDVCDGCGKCVLACIQENNIALAGAERAKLGQFMHWIELHGGVPAMCFHCADAPCEKVCPTGAANHTPDGLSAMMYKRCTGSRFCGANCPVHARKFNFDDPVSTGRSLKFNENVPVRTKGVMEKCSLCLQRLQDDRMEYKSLHVGEGGWRGRGVTTACAAACPKNAIIFGNWLDDKSPLVVAAKNRMLYAPREVASLNPSIVYMRGYR